MEWLELWMPFLTVLIGPAGLIVVLINWWAKKKKPDITPVEESKAFASVEAESGLNREGLQFAQDALTQAARAMAQTEAMSKRLDDAEGKIKSQGEELRLFRRSYNALYAWALDHLENWDIVRQQKERPKLPHDIHEP